MSCRRGALRRATSNPLDTQGVSGHAGTSGFRIGSLTSHVAGEAPMHARSSTVPIGTDALVVIGFAVVAGALLVAIYGPGLLSVVFGLLCALLAPIVVVDRRQLRIPNRLVGPGVAGALVAVAAVACTQGRPTVVLSASVGAVLFALPLLVMHLVSPAGLGFGDVKLGLLLGLALGLVHPVLAPIGLAAGCVLEVTSRVARRRWRGPEPFAPALAAGTILVLATGPRLVAGLELGWPS